MLSQSQKLLPLFYNNSQIRDILFGVYVLVFAQITEVDLDERQLVSGVI